MSAFKYFDIVKHVKASGGPLTTEVEACVALVCASTDDGRPLTGGTNLIRTVVDWVDSLQVLAAGMYKRHS